MKTYTKEELLEVLRQHSLWYYDNSKGSRANLYGADLGGANLYRANLRSADLRSADLGGADLGGADLRSANLGGANLYGANLYGADLRSADLGGADLRSANLRSADLGGANLRSANLRSADLRSADLRSANLRSADLGGADLRSADLRSADLRSADLRSADLGGADLRSADLSGLESPLSPNQIAQFRIVPEIGGFYGFKKVQPDNTVLKLFIPDDAKRLNSFGSRKCRASKVKVVEVIQNDGIKSVSEVFHSPNNTVKLEYKIGQEVSVNDFCEDLAKECAAGIHFFLTYEEAKAW
jgi:uncharacterized protein YjbI with pentapeptide repeats